MTDAIKPLYTAHGTAQGGRNGHTQSDDGMVSVDLSVPKEMGGPGKPNTATPEHLFAAGYAACFGGALDFVAHSHKKSATGASVTCSVSIGPREAGGFGIAVKMSVVDPLLAQADLDPADLASNDFEIEWPPRSGRMASFPEIDRIAWFNPATALEKILASQRPFIVEALERLRAAPAVEEE